MTLGKILHIFDIKIYTQQYIQYKHHKFQNNRHTTTNLIYFKVMDFKYMKRVLQSHFIL